MTSRIEREVKFLDIDVKTIKNQLKELGAEDQGEHLLTEVIFYFGNSGKPEGKKDRRYVRVRSYNAKIFLTYKRLPPEPSIGVQEIEFEVGNAEEAKAFVEALGWTAARQQEKRRHTFFLNNITFDIDTWPNVPPYIEIEAETEEEIKKGASLLGLEWETKIIKSAAGVLKDYYDIDVWSLKKYTFEEVQ